MNNVFKNKFPEWSTILALSPEELAYELAIGLNKKRGQAPNVGTFKLTREKLVDAIASAYGIDYTVRLTLMTGLEAAVKLGLIVEMESGERDRSYVFLTAIGLGIDDENSALQHRKATLHVYDVLDESIVQTVWSTVLRGDYDIAVAYAFKRVEVEMRNKGGFGNDDFGERLVKKFFSSFRSPGEASGLENTSLTAVEKFFISTLGLYRNPATHLDNTIKDYARTMEVLLMANHQLHLVRSATRRDAS